MVKGTKGEGDVLTTDDDKRFYGFYAVFFKRARKRETVRTKDRIIAEIRTAPANECFEGGKRNIDHDRDR